MMDKNRLEQALSELPLYIYSDIDPKSLEFAHRVRYICEHDCPMYGKSWACPPAVGTVAECRARCLAYPSVLVISTIAEVHDIASIDETLGTRAPHEALTHEVLALVKQACGGDAMALSTESCAICEKCAWPDAPCRFPEKMFPCVESYGILVTALAEKHEQKE